MLDRSSHKNNDGDTLDVLDILVSCFRPPQEIKFLPTPPPGNLSLENMHESDLFEGRLTLTLFLKDALPAAKTKIKLLKGNNMTTLHCEDKNTLSACLYEIDVTGGKERWKSETLFLQSFPGRLPSENFSIQTNKRCRSKDT